MRRILILALACLFAASASGESRSGALALINSGYSPSAQSCVHSRGSSPWGNVRSGQTHSWSTSSRPSSAWGAQRSGQGRPSPWGNVRSGQTQSRGQSASTAISAFFSAVKAAGKRVPASRASRAISRAAPVWRATRITRSAAPYAMATGSWLRNRGQGYTFRENVRASKEYFSNPIRNISADARASLPSAQPGKR